MAKKHWIYIKRGLSEDPKHRAAMGECVWLFMHIIDRADWETGIAYEWKDQQEAVDMGMPVDTLRTQRRKLEELDYIRCRQKQHNQDIYIVEWKNPRDYGSETRNPRNQGVLEATPSEFEGGIQGCIQGGNQVTSQVKTPTSNSESKSLSDMAFLQPLGLDWLIASGQEVTQDMVDKATRQKNARDDFEKVFGFGSLPWSSNSAWTKFESFVVKIYTSDPTVFEDYVAWRKDGGKYTAFSNRKIRENPLAFMDTGYPEFEASKMYSPGAVINSASIEATKQLIEKKTSGEFVPRPAAVPPPAIAKRQLSELARRKGIRK